MNLPKHFQFVPVLLLCGFVSAGGAQELAERSLPPSHIGEALSEMTIHPDEISLPAELRAESAIFLQRRLGEWTESDARRFLGTPQRRRDAYEQGTVTGDIFAYRDPSRRYREFELLFDRRSKALTGVYIYPWRMNWEECRDLWGDDVNVTEMANGHVFRSYRSRRLDVLVDKSGSVINLGIY